jgi:hypothetical protein
VEAAKTVTPPTSSGPGLLLFINRVFHETPAPPVKMDQLRTILQAYLKLSADIGSIVFRKTLAPFRAKYDMVIADPKSSFYQRKLFDFAEPSKLFTERFLLQETKTLEERDLIRVFKLDWRNQFVFANIVSILKQHPGSNILLWIGQNHVPYLVWMIVQSKAFTQAQRNQMRVITNKTDPNLSCDLKKVLNTIRTGEGSTPLPDWQTKFGFN